MSAVDVTELRAGAYSDALALAVRNAPAGTVSTVLTTIEGPAPAPGNRTLAREIAEEAAARAHQETPPRHVALIRYEILITAADVEALRLPPNLLDDAEEFAVSRAFIAADLRLVDDDLYAAAVIMVTIPCPGAHRC